MKASTREWLSKAEEDFLAASALNRRRKKPLWNVVAFHVQQTVEKYLKARLAEAGGSIPKTHDLLHLLNLVTALEPLWSAYHSAFSLLASYAVQTRYPGTSATKADARHALKLCRQFRKEARRALGVH
jgi:HEPN domain-containing protein